MYFLIADTFTNSLARLTGDEQKAVKTTAFDLQMNPANPGMSFHKLDKARDKNFWSVRVNRDIRIIVHKTEGSLLLCYVDHHDNAYTWAERRKLEIHPKTGAAQIVEIRERVQEVVRPVVVERQVSAVSVSKRKLFEEISDDELLGYGVPSEWLEDVRHADEDSLLTLADRLPAEASEALLELATGGTPKTIKFFSTDSEIDPFDHPDAQRRFRVMATPEELKRALEYPWDKWTIFLHPEQRHLVERTYSGPARVSGSAGTGKTIVALHRAVHLAKANPDSRVLLTTFSHILANALRTKLNRLISDEPRLAERLEVHSINAIGARLYKSHFGAPNLASHDLIRDLIRKASQEEIGHKFTFHFLLTEWEHVVDAWKLERWESYRDVIRLGRKIRLPEPQRVVLWSIFERIRKELKAQGLITISEMLTKLSGAVAKASHPPFDFAVIDEAQDMGVAHIRFLGALGGNRPEALFFAGDLGQRIFQQPFSWLTLGVDVRGRSRSLKVNYRTSHQIRSQADRLLGGNVSDADGNTEQRGDAISVFNGPEPKIQTLKSQEEEAAVVSTWLKGRLAEGIQPHECAVFVRSDRELDRATSAVKQTGVAFKMLDENVETISGQLSIGTMHLAKGLEFRAVVVMACDDEVIPLQERIESVGDESDLKEVYDTERQLLYVACTRARDHLLVTACVPGSEFLDDLKVN